MHEQWLAQHPDDLAARVDFAESHFTTERFSKGVARISELLTDPVQSSRGDEKGPGLLDASIRAALLVLLAANQVALGDTDKARGTVATLTKQIEDQSPDFRLGWAWNGTRHFIEHTEQPPIVKQRDWLLRLLTAVECKNRDDILERLKELTKGR